MQPPPPSNVVPWVGVTLHAGETDPVDVPNAVQMTWVQTSSRRGEASSHA
jgi:hypothetical protein